MRRTYRTVAAALTLSIVTVASWAASVHDDHGSITWVKAPLGLKFPATNWTASRMVGHFGRPAQPGTAGRIVVVTPAMRWVNVTQDDVVRFVVGDRAFEWVFATHTTQAFDLAQVAPPGFLPPNTQPTIYVEPNPMYKGGG
jgi:hypothetical protein